MRPISEHCPKLSQAVPTSVPTSGFDSRACPKRPKLFCSRTYHRAHSIYPSIYPFRLGHLGQLGQTNHGGGFAVPTCFESLGQLGQRTGGGKERCFLLPVAGRCQRFLRGGLHRGQFGPRFACMSWFQILVPVGAEWFRWVP